MISTVEAAQILDCSDAWIRKLIYRGLIRAEKIGRDWVLDGRDIGEIQRMLSSHGGSISRAGRNLAEAGN
jgi:excisionase family DNA binding protein